MESEKFEQAKVENKPEKKEKPETLFIGTQAKGIKEFTPGKGKHRDENEGAVIFSTPDRALASVFMMKDHNDSWTKIGYYRDILVVVICMDRDKYIKKDNGGVIYEVPSEKFDYDPHKGMGEKEYTSREPVKPIDETSYPSSLDTMIDNGVQVYFVDEKTFKDIWAAEDYGKEIIYGLTSENKRRGKNIRTLY
jgi:hypothetical protein